LAVLHNWNYLYHNVLRLPAGAFLAKEGYATLKQITSNE